MAEFVLDGETVGDVVLDHVIRTGQTNALKVIGQEFLISGIQVLGQVVGILDNLDLVPKTLFKQWFGQVPNASKTLGRIDNEEYIHTYRDVVLQYGHELKTSVHGKAGHGPIAHIGHAGDAVCAGIFTFHHGIDGIDQIVRNGLFGIRLVVDAIIDIVAVIVATTLNAGTHVQYLVTFKRCHFGNREDCLEISHRET
jgi:hypothetical protein